MLKVDVDLWVARLRAIDWAKRITVAQVELGLLGALAPFCKERPEMVANICRRTAVMREGERQVFIPLDGDKTTGEVLVFEVALGPVDSPDHIHGRSPDADYGERYWTLDGEIEDVSDDGRPFTHCVGDEPVTHGPDTRHQPRIPRWWVGIFYHPAGSKPVPP